MRCKNCVEGTSTAACDACRKTQEEGRWLWELDNGQRFCRCPVCGFRNRLGLYVYRNPFRYCAGCGTQMIAREQLSLFGDEIR